MTVALGFYTPTINVPTALSQIGGKAAILNSFFGMSNAFPSMFMAQCATAGAIPLVTLQPNDLLLTDIAAGKYDAVIDAWASEAKAYGKTMYLRPMHEMNGKWYSWGYPKNTPGAFVAAWIRIVNLFRAAGATNVQFVWCVSMGGNMDTTLIQALYPGDEYVDWMSMDGYNRNDNGVWQSFRSIFDSGYEMLTDMSEKPIIIAETGCVEDIANQYHKQGWIHNTFTHVIAEYAQIEAVCYFNAPGGGNYSYPWDSSSHALAEIQDTFASGGYVI
jgi:beta-mannanase